MKTVYEGAGGSGPITDADNLFSRDVAELTLAYGEGPIKGLYQDSAKSIKVAGTSLQTDDVPPKFNFEDFVISIHQGYYNDTHLKYVLGGESSLLANQAYGRILRNEERTIIIPAGQIEGLTAIDLRFLIGKLYSRGDSSLQAGMAMEISWLVVGADESTRTYIHSKDVAKALTLPLPADVGYTGGTVSSTHEQRLINRNAHFLVTLGLGEFAGTSLSGHTNDEIRRLYQVVGKTSQGFIEEVSFPVPGGADIAVNVKLTHGYYSWFKFLRIQTPGIYDPIEELFWESASLTGKNNVLHPNLFCAQVVAEMTDRFTSLPDISLDVNGLIISVPQNYNPETRVYSGFWNGAAFKPAWSDNPVWVLRYLIMSKQHGIAKTRPSVMVNEFQFYAAAQYCDQLVADTTGATTEPRYSYNDVITEVRDAEEFLTYLAGSFNAIVYQQGGVYQLLIDQPREALLFFNPEMVGTDGFSYSFSDLSTRYNDMTVLFANRASNFEEDCRRIYYQNGIDVHGAITDEFQAVGCTGLNESLRKAYFRMITNLKETTSLTFTTTRLGLHLRLYDNFYVADRDMDWGESGRFLNRVGNTLVLRDTLDIPQGVYRCDIILGSGKFGFFVFYSHANRYELQIQAENDIYPQFTGTDEPFILGSNAIGFPQLFRTVSVSAVDDTVNIFRVEALNVYAEKYDQTDNVLYNGGDQGIVVNVINTLNTSAVDKTPPAPAVVLQGGTYVYSFEGKHVLRVKITPHKYARRWIIDWTIKGFTFTVDIVTPYFEIDLEEFGVLETYTVSVRAVSSLGKQSIRTTVIYAGYGHQDIDIPPVEGLTSKYIDQFRLLEISWYNPFIPVLTGYRLTISDSLGNTVFLADQTSTQYTGVFNHDLGFYTVKVFAIEGGIVSSQFAEDTFEVAQIVLDAPASGNIFVNTDVSPYEISAGWNAVSSPYFQNYQVTTFTADDNVTSVFDTVDPLISLGLERETEYSVKVKTRSIHGLLSNNTLELLINTTVGSPPVDLVASYNVNTAEVTVSWTNQDPLFTTLIELMLDTPIYLETSGLSVVFQLQSDLAIDTYVVNGYAKRGELVGQDFTTTTFDVVEIRYLAPAGGSLVLNRSESPNRIEVSWLEVYGATDYLVQMEGTTGLTNQVVLGLGTSFQHLGGDEVVTVRVWSRNQFGTLSESFWVGTIAVILAIPPQSYTATYDSSLRILILSWVGASTAEFTDYKVEVSRSENPNSTLAGLWLSNSLVPEGYNYTREINLNLEAGEYVVRLTTLVGVSSVATCSVTGSQTAVYITMPSQLNFAGTLKLVDPFNSPPTAATYRYRLNYSGGNSGWLDYGETNSAWYGQLGVLFSENTTSVDVERTLEGVVTSTSRAFNTPYVHYYYALPTEVFTVAPASGSNVLVTLTTTFLTSGSYTSIQPSRPAARGEPKIRAVPTQQYLALSTQLTQGLNSFGFSSVLVDGSTPKLLSYAFGYSEIGVLYLFPCNTGDFVAMNDYL